MHSIRLDRGPVCSQWHMGKLTKHSRGIAPVIRTRLRRISRTPPHRGRQTRSRPFFLQATTPIGEADETTPVDPPLWAPYSRSKAEAEKIVVAANSPPDFESEPPSHGFDSRLTVLPGMGWRVSETRTSLSGTDESHSLPRAHEPPSLYFLREQDGCLEDGGLAGG